MRRTTTLTALLLGSHAPGTDRSRHRRRRDLSRRGRDPRRHRARLAGHRGSGRDRHRRERVRVRRRGRRRDLRDGVGHRRQHRRRRCRAPATTSSTARACRPATTSTAILGDGADTFVGGAESDTVDAGATDGPMQTGRVGARRDRHRRRAGQRLRGVAGAAQRRRGAARHRQRRRLLAGVMGAGGVLDAGAGRRPSEPRRAAERSTSLYLPTGFASVDEAFQADSPASSATPWPTPQETARSQVVGTHGPTTSRSTPRPASWRRLGDGRRHLQAARRRWPAASSTSEPARTGSRCSPRSGGRPRPGGPHPRGRRSEDRARSTVSRTPMSSPARCASRATAPTTRSAGEAARARSTVGGGDGLDRHHLRARSGRPPSPARGRRSCWRGGKGNDVIEGKLYPTGSPAAPATTARGVEQGRRRPRRRRPRQARGQVGQRQAHRRRRSRHGDRQQGPRPVQRRGREVLRALTPAPGASAAASLRRMWRWRRTHLGTEADHATFRTLHTASLAAPALREGLTQTSAERSLRHLRALLGTPAAALTDTSGVLAWDGVGHHHAAEIAAAIGQLPDDAPTRIIRDRRLRLRDPPARDQPRRGRGGARRHAGRGCVARDRQPRPRRQRGRRPGSPGSSSWPVSTTRAPR